MNIINTKEKPTQEPLNVKNEIDSYIDYLTKDFLKDFNLPKNYFANLTKENDSKLTVFKFWSNDIIINKFPIISQVACDILSVPATQASCERVFSISGNSLNTKRHFLNPIKLEREVMLIYNKQLLNI